ncbi:hypothetical protein EDB83DRAFT_2537237 [Lactarius deliciosus]|nr:hypothetical protein EDB83DRAFT_2537237 [Lactarius deliciosus]
MRLLFSVSVSIVWVTIVNAQYSVYQPKNQVIFGGSSLNYTNTAAAAAASYTGAAAYDPTILNPPAVPNPPIPTQVPVQLTSTGGIPNLSIPQNGGFFGFSIEMSVSNQVCDDLSGKNSSYLQVPFLNLMANLVERVGWVQVRVGGNSQENAELVESLPNGRMLAKDTNNTSNPTASRTPTGTIGIPFLNTTPFSLEIVENGQQILGDYLLGFQAGNEPMIFTGLGLTVTGRRSDHFTCQSSKNPDTTNREQSLDPKKDNLLIVPSVQTSWTPESVWDTGIVSSYSSSILSLAVER